MRAQFPLFYHFSMKSFLLLAPLILIAALIGLSQKSHPKKIIPVSEELREAFNLKPFYKKALIKQ